MFIVLSLSHGTKISWFEVCQYLGIRDNFSEIIGMGDIKFYSTLLGQHFTFESLVIRHLNVSQIFFNQ